MALPIHLPALRERGNDILLIARFVLETFCRENNLAPKTLSVDAQKKLTTYSYPGNVRELQYTIERAIIMSDGEILAPQDLIFSPIESVPVEVNDTDDLNLSSIEKNTILRVIEKHNGNITKAAKELGLTRTALYRRLSKYDI